MNGLAGLSLGKKAHGRSGSPPRIPTEIGTCAFPFRWCSMNTTGSANHRRENGGGESGGLKPSYEFATVDATVDVVLAFQAACVLLIALFMQARYSEFAMRNWQFPRLKLEAHSHLEVVDGLGGTRPTRVRRVSTHRLP